MIPPAALCVHLCIGQAYAFSVFNLPMTKLLGISQSWPDDWELTDLGWIFSIGIFFLGAAKTLVTARNVLVYDALRTPQFWLIWWVLCLNVTAASACLGGPRP